MLEKSLIITGSDAEILSRAIEQIKAKAYDEREVSLDDTQAFHALISGLTTAEEEEKDNETRHMYLNSLRKRMVLGTVIGRSGVQQG
ncbi:MAG TPA: hypothetical protein VEG65_04785 [Candidatus Bathyarchaeia archaeon]|nr:hypothetical protein [Candidatus Bathyarchaeia archaeon]